MTQTTENSLDVQSQLPVISFDYPGLKAWAKGVVEKYSGLVVTEDTTVEVKKDMADINKKKKAMDDARKEAVRLVSEPVRVFEAQIKEICGIFDTAYAKLGEQVKAFEDAQREEKRKAVEGLIAEANTNAFGEPAFLPIPIQEKWLNKTTTLKSVREDVSLIIDRYMEEEQRKKALEQARQDRMIAIESHVKAMNEQHGTSLPAATFMGESHLRPETPLQSVLDTITGRVKADRAAAEQLAARRQQQAVQPTEQPQPLCVPQSEHKSACVSESAKNDTQAAPAQTITMSIVMEYAPEKDATVKALLDALEKHCISFATRVR